MKIKLIVKHTYKPKNPVRKIVKTVKYTANADGTVTTSSSKKVLYYDKDGNLPEEDSTKVSNFPTGNSIIDNGIQFTKNMSKK